MINENEKPQIAYPHPPVPVSIQLPSTENAGRGPDFQDSADLRDYLEVVLRRKWLICSVLFASFITTLIVSFTMQPLYKANGKIELSPQALKVTKFDELARLGSQLQTREFMQTQLKLLQSESLADRVIDRLQLESHPAFNPPAKSNDISILTRIKRSVKKVLAALGRTSTEQTSDSQLQQLILKKNIEAKFIKNLNLNVERDTTLISISFTSPEPALSREVVNTLIQEFMAWEVDKKVDSSITAKKQLEKQIDLARTQLEKAESNLNEFARKAGIVSLSSNLNLIYSQLEEANKAYAIIQTERMNKEALYNQARQGSSSIPAVIESQLIQKLRSDYISLTAEYKEATVTFKDDYPKLQTMKAKILDIDKQTKAEENRIIESVKNDYLTSLKKEEAMRQDTESKKTLAMELNDKATQYKILEREVETGKLIHQSLFERSRELDAKVGTELGNIQIVDYATLPLEPYKPKIPLNLALSLVVGMIAGFGVAFLLEYLDNTIKRIDELSDRFQVPVLGVLPLVQVEEAKNLGSIVRLKPTAGFSESIRTAKVSIQLSSSLDQRPKLLVMTSTSAGEGKSTITANLGQAFAPEEKVLLIDADLRKPTLHKHFSTNGYLNGKRKGLSNFLTGGSSLEDVIRDTEVPNLQVIFAGPIPPNPAELLASNRMRQLLEETDKLYDRIIIDGPPATGFADALILGHYANGVILVSTLGQTHREALRIFRRSLVNVGGRLIGSLVNKLNITNRYGGYYYKYYKYYHKYYSYQPAYRQDSPATLLSSSVDKKGEEEA